MKKILKKKKMKKKRKTKKMNEYIPKYYNISDILNFLFLIKFDKIR